MRPLREAALLSFLPGGEFRQRGGESEQPAIRYGGIAVHPSVKQFFRYVETRSKLIPPHQ